MGTQELLPTKFASDATVVDGATKDRGAQSDKAFASIRNCILLGELKPGEKLRVEVLQRDLSLSSTPVREALNRLTTEGLVTFEENRGFRTAPITASDLRDITRLRLLVESEALSDSMVCGDDAWEANVVAANYRLTQHEQRIAAGEIERGEPWTVLHKAFHMALLSACSYPRILKTCDQLFDQSERYRRFATRVRVLKRDVSAEHQAIMEAVLARNTKLAVDLLGHHIAKTGENVAKILGEAQTTAKR
ncbi:GntR family transcriptional regulator [Burkholderia sp. BCC0405]|uniref:GntR family transcriptional regulator n=1 Tax=Burkholderia sp. BCC0405 TaxID=2676298 RepID=UPI00158A1A53|nr:GntR family transcriptional regulator [Burkholderia sp. BCC0405]